MVRRSRTVIIGGGYAVQSTGSQSITFGRYEFDGNGLNAINILDGGGNPVFCNLSSIELHVMGQLKSESDYTLEQGENGTILTPKKYLPVPLSGQGHNCIILYRVL